MQKAMGLLVIFFPIVCAAQTLQTDTLQTNKTISSIDSLEHNHQTIKTVIVRKYMHNETTVSFKYLFDSVTYQLYKCQYQIRTDNPDDSILETTCFYVDGDRFVAVILATERNGINLNSQLVYLDAKQGYLTEFFQLDKTKSNKEEIKSRSTDLWFHWTSLKEWLQKKNGG